VKNSMRMHPIENMSQGKDHPRPEGGKERDDVSEGRSKRANETSKLTEDDLRSSVVSRRNDRRVVLLLERS